MKEKQLCEICKELTYLDMHHIHSISLGGSNEPSNIARLCGTCHKEVHFGEIIIEGRFETTKGNSVVWHRLGEESVTGMKPPPVFLMKESDREKLDLDRQKNQSEDTEMKWFDPTAGAEANDLFVKTMNYHSYWVRKSNPYEDMHLHIDWWIKDTEDGKEIPVDVKSLKRIKRSDDEPQEDWLWIEFKNGEGKKGWIDGEAEFIVFERFDSFMFVSRQELRDLSYNVVDFDENVSCPTNAKYKVYNREKWKRKDLLSLIETSLVIENTSHVFFKKPEEKISAKRESSIK